MRISPTTRASCYASDRSGKQPVLGYDRVKRDLNMRRFAFALLSVLLVSCGGGGSGSGPPTLMSITVTPATSDLPNGRTQQLKATGNLSDSTTKDLTNSVFWTSG